jgi:hypothetical protein
MPRLLASPIRKISGEEWQHFADLSIDFGASPEPPKPIGYPVENQ